jgi:hypothetical protein
MIAVIAALLLIAAPALVAQAGEGKHEYGETISGKISAIDPSGKTISLEQKGAPSKEIVVKDDTSVMVCDEEKTLADIKVGSEVNVTFYEMAGRNVADSIRKPC